MLAFASLVVVLTIPSQEVNLDKLILAIEERETGHWYAAGGRAQWQQRTWAQFTSLSFYFASDPYWSRKVMHWALEDYTRRFVEAGIKPTAWRLATAWRRGWDGAVRTRRQYNDYGEQVANLVMQ